jgi:hypothetical protein
LDSVLGRPAVGDVVFKDPLRVPTRLIRRS